MTLTKQRPDHGSGTRVELGFMGDVLHVELPVGLDEQQMQAIPSTPDLQKRQPVCTELVTELAHSQLIFAGVGRLAS